ncbi:MAG TPA: hypothetical protein VE010_24700 [Thermoanaerobaculia bacterium]|nr:hypothetical protein [Thermoanaerobaculia bacterium]
MEDVRPTERHLLHFPAVSHAPEAESLTFRIAQRDYNVQRHTAATRSDARDVNPLLRLYRDEHLTHYLEAELPSDAIALAEVTRRIEVDGHQVEAVASLSIHVPREGRRNALELARRKNAHVADSLHPKLMRHLGRFTASAQSQQLLRVAAEQPDLLHDVFDPFETAMALLYQHPSLINLSLDQGGVVPAFILRECIASALHQRSTVVDRIEDLGFDWCKYRMLKDEGEVVREKDGTPIFTADLDGFIQRAMADPLSIAIKLSQQREELEGETWRQQYGRTTAEDRKAFTAAVAGREVLRANKTKWARKALSSEWGVSFGAIEFSEPRPGGWRIDAAWSTDDSPAPMTAEFVTALLSGQAFLLVDGGTRPGARSHVAIPAKTTAGEEFTRWELDFGLQSDSPWFQTGSHATLTLDPLRTDLFVRVNLGPMSAESLLRIHLGMVKNGEETIVWSRDSTGDSFGEIRLKAKNERLRHLSAYAEFFDTQDRPIPVGRSLANIPAPVALLFDTHPTKRYIGVVPPVDAVFGVPLPAEERTLSIPFPQEAAKMRLYWGGLGTGHYDETVCACGITATVVFELALPVLLLALGAAEYKTGFVAKLLEDPKVLYGAIGVGATLIGGGSGAYIGLAQDPGRAAQTVGVKLGPALGKMALGKFSLYLARKTAEGTAKRLVPFVNFAMFMMDVAATTAQLAQTIYAISQSPWYYDMEITRTFDLAVTIKPDPQFGKFPDYHEQLKVQVLYDSGAELKHTTTELPRETISKPIDVRFNDAAAGGRVKVMVFFYSASGWLSGSGATGWLDAKGDGDGSLKQVEVTIKNALIPLSANSVYQHRQSTVMDGGKQKWKAGPAPTATIATRPRDPAHEVLAWTGITVAQRPGMIGYSWQAKGTGLPRDKAGAPTNDALYVVQNLSLLDDPSARHAVTPVGFSAQSGVTYDLTSGNDGSGRSFFIDPSRGAFDPATNPAGGYHLRRIALSADSTPRFDVASNESWGRFPRPVDSFVFHPQGRIAAISLETDKIYLLELPTAPTTDDKAKLASLASGEGVRDGLLSRPRAIAVALDGRLLVLEDGNRRIQSFDYTGNPVKYFKSTDDVDKSCTMALRDTGTAATYLDLSVESKGYLFVLAFEGDTATAKASQYRVDIYQPDGTFLVSTPGVAAAKIAVDLARSLFTLNYETLSGPGGRTEPSISMWLPPPPPKSEGAPS